jgi:hypothetical protein
MGRASIELFDVQTDVQIDVQTDVQNFRGCLWTAMDRYGEIFNKQAMFFASMQ